MYGTNRSPDVSLVVTLHDEGTLAYSSLVSIAKSVHALSRDCETILVLDRVDEGTAATVAEALRRLEWRCRIENVDFGDPSLSRNFGIAASTAPFVGVVDGDDLISENYLAAHLEAAESASLPCVIRPALVVTFGAEQSFQLQPDESTNPISRESMLSINPWISAAFAERSILEENPWHPIVKPGFGYEDWHWNCELMAAGIRNFTAPETTYFYRRRKGSSRNINANMHSSWLPKSGLFATQVPARRGTA